MSYTPPTDQQLTELLTGNPTIAMVGASAKRDRPSNHVMRVLLGAGYKVIPVTPNEEVVAGQRAYPSLDAIPERVDIVDVFRRSEETPTVADAAVKVGAKVLWLQLGISSDDAAERAEAGGMTVVMDMCIAQAVRRLGLKAGTRRVGGVADPGE